MHCLTRISLLFCFLCSLFSANAQRVALSTNTFDWLLMSPNLSVEARMSKHVTFDIGLSVNPFNSTPYGSDIKLQNFRVYPEVRYWLRRPMADHYFGIAAEGGYFNLRLRDRFVQADMLAAGITYGYALVLSRHWNMTFSIGVGLGRIRGYDYRSADGSPESMNMSKWIPVPMKTGISFSYIFK